MQPTKGANVAHWVLKIGSLKTSMEFFENILGLRVLRHEEFATGCEATCNGPYGGKLLFTYLLTRSLIYFFIHVPILIGAWSKTMIGYGPEKENFALVVSLFLIYSMSYLLICLRNLHITMVLIRTLSVMICNTLH